MAKEAQKLIANNKKAYHDYFVEEKYEAGLVLHGTEVKSLRMGKCSIKEAFVSIDRGEAWVNGMHIRCAPESFSCIKRRSRSWPERRRNAAIP